IYSSDAQAGADRNRLGVLAVCYSRVMVTHHSALRSGVRETPFHVMVALRAECHADVPDEAIARDCRAGRVSPHSHTIQRPMPPHERQTPRANVTILSPLALRYMKRSLRRYQRPIARGRAATWVRSRGKPLPDHS